MNTFSTMKLNLSKKAKVRTVNLVDFDMSLMRHLPDGRLMILDRKTNNIIFYSASMKIEETLVSQVAPKDKSTPKLTLRSYHSKIQVYGR